MMLTHFHYNFSFPAVKEPEWGPLVERWYQLDAPAFGVAQVYWQNRRHLATPPAWLFLCSPAASNGTDSVFALTAQPSPAKFVHTLPNIRSAALLQVMKWAGPVLCLQNDPDTILTGLSEGFALGEELGGPVWVVSVTEGAEGYAAHIFVLDAQGELKIRKTAPEAMANAATHDKQWLSWISNKTSQSFQGSGLWIG